ncbi:lipase [Infundibulicybe gibba]|nr:lipase [Infundibulicybe gibba]
MVPMDLLLFSLFLLGSLELAWAVPLLDARASITTLSSAQISAFKPFSFYATTAYCSPASILAWSCGTNCKANPTFQPIAAGGNSVDVQFWYVGIDPTLKTIIVGHEGTTPDKIVPLFTDANFIPDKLNATLFPGLDSAIKVHSGFADEHAKTATSVLAAVKSAMKKSGLKSITLVGHSLGAALTLLESVYLPLNIPGATFKTIGYGMPRVGNQAFADFVDKNTQLTHINNQQDFVPILPGRNEGFHHPQGEKHIQNDLSWVDCPGQDNTDKKCIVGDVPNFFKGNVQDHLGPYDGVKMGSATCSS